MYLESKYNLFSTKITKVIVIFHDLIFNFVSMFLRIVKYSKMMFIKKSSYLQFYSNMIQRSMML